MAKSLGKADIGAHTATKLQGTHTEGNAALNAVLDSITEALKQGSSVTLTGFGTFEVREIKARKVHAVRGAQAGQMVSVPAHKRAAFRAGTELARAVTEK
jgi:DNA-binding protein HU-beta